MAIAFVTMGIGVNARTSFSLLFPPILDEFGWGRGTVAAAFSIGFIVTTILTPIAGTLMDRYGPRIVIPLGAALVSLGLGTAPFASQPWHFYMTLGVLVVGGSIFTSYIGHVLFLPNWFDRRRGFAIGLAFSGVGVGSITLFPWMQSSIQTDGWRVSCWILAAIVLVVVLPLNLLFQRHRPEDIGLVPDGDTAAREPIRQPAKDASGPVAKGRPEDRVVDHAWAATEWTLRAAMSTARFWWLMLALTASLYAWYAVQVHQTRYLIDIGISAKLAAVALGLVGVASIGGQIFIGHFSDRVGREWAWTVSLLGFVATYGCLLLLRVFPSEPLMYAMVFLQGFLGYGLATVFAAVPSELFAGRRYGAIFGILGAAAGAGAAFGPYATGVLYDAQGTYNAAFVVAVAVCAVSIFAMWQAGPRKVRLVPGRVTVRLHD